MRMDGERGKSSKREKLLKKQKSDMWFLFGGATCRDGGPGFSLLQPACVI